ncbi:hypothetical protein FB45DRAFT_1050708 [Roridomyces roridus]|uniref:BTB domain-containing protein n=1 Tax=Roridomyces roridus TaxID=1738132 RepID=A0AAD7G2L6_9AGAR|nr:hypothetical protein FB45DRAFT_1050708 [Roridomyces roridus]
MSGPPDAESQPPPGKRQRTEQESRHLIRSNIWKPYGDIVLLAESTLFKVNRTILVEHSSVFEGLFSIPQPQSAEAIDGCPVVELSDAAQDVELLLSALYNPFFQKPQQPYELVAAMLRLGKKYEIDQFKADAIARIRHEFSTKDECLDPSRKVEPKIEPRAGLEVDLLNLVSETGLYTCIPGLVLRCLIKWSLSELFRGVPRPTIGSPAVIDDPTKVKLAYTLEKLRDTETRFSVWLHRAEVRCQTACVAQTQMWGKTTYNMGYEMRANGSHSFQLRVWKHGDLVGGGDMAVVGTMDLCRQCSDAVKGGTDSLRWKMWDKLPSYLGLAEWVDLKDDV